MEGPDGTVYVLPPPMAGFFEFSMMRVRDDVDQKLLSELFYEYITVEDDFILSLFTHGDDPARARLRQRAGAGRERAGAPARGDGGLQRPGLRARQRGDRDRRAHGRRRLLLPPQDGARRAGLRRPDEHLHDVRRERRLADPPRIRPARRSRRGDGPPRGGPRPRTSSSSARTCSAAVDFICNCCGCCCEAMIAARRFGMLDPVHTTNFLPHVADELCNGCGKCVDACPVEAMTLVSANDPQQADAGAGRSSTPTSAWAAASAPASARRRGSGSRRAPERVVTPVDTLHRIVLMAIERGRLAGLHLRQPGALQPPRDGARSSA